MIVDKAKLKELAEGMKGWDKMTECWPCDENGPDWQVGQLDEEENRYPVMTIDTEQYDCEADAPKVAQYYAAANPAAVLALLAEIDKLKAKLVYAYNRGYMEGHHDTVEGQFTDIHQSDMRTYHGDVVAEIAAETE